MEYVIERDGQYVTQHQVLKGTEVQWTRNHKFASVFKSRTRAEAVASKHQGAVELYFGAALPQGTKQFTTPKQSPVNGRSAYRSI